MQKLDLLVLGTGPAATKIAIGCGEAGWNVAVVDPRPVGGTCALRGCNPKKVLVRAAELYDWIERAEGTGLRTENPRIDWSELIAFKRSFTDPVTSWKEGKFRDAGIEVLHGLPQFLSPDHLAIDGQEIASRRTVVATGAVPVKLGIPGEERVTTSDEFLELDRLPKRVLFIGGGYISFTWR
jgi:glutathione reductase (NADPH)